MEIHAKLCILRPFHESDIPRLVELANNRKVWRNLMDGFPHPYTISDAEQWIEHCAYNMDAPLDLAIEMNGEFAGGIGCKILGDVLRHTREVGYWLGEPYWGQGVATDALEAWTRHLFADPEVHRCQAHVFGWNKSSARVLEKCGYRHEGTLRDAFFKDGVFTDALYYGRLRP